MSPLSGMSPAWCIVFLAMLSVFCCAGHAPRAGGMPLPYGVVATCFDGDTIKLTDRRVIRLAGIDTPELHQGTEPPQYYAREAMLLTQRLARGMTVRLRAAGEAERDRYGRIVADVLLPDGRSCSEVLVREGAALVYPHANLDADFLARLCALQREAIIERRGMWEHVLSLPAARTTYVGNRQSRRFFPADNAYAQRIKPRNRVIFGTLMDAFMAGYAPARPATFWPQALSPEAPPREEQ